MSDDAQISYSFSMGPQSGVNSPGEQSAATPSGQTGAALYAVDDYDTLDVAGGALLVGKSTGAQMLVMPEVAMVLPHCTVFRTLQEHAQHLVAVFPQLGGNAADALRVLGLVRDAGLLVSAEQICQRVNVSAPTRPLGRSKTFVITCDRPQAVERLLESMLQHAPLAQQEALYLVDDSRDAANAERNRDAVARFNLVSPTTLHYVGEVEQQRLAQALEAVVPTARESIAYLLQRAPWGDLPTYGRSRTLCLLLSVGSRCVVMDDDVLCQALTSPEQADGVAFSNGMRDARFYGQASQWQQQWRPAATDPLSGHARCLGMGLGQALTALGVSRLEPAHLRGVSPSLFRNLNAATQVLVTQSGTLGDPGTVTNAWITKLGPDAVRRMLASPGGLQTALATRECWLGQPRPTFTKRPAMSQVTGLDNRECLPPYFPALRGEDQLFGAMLEFLFPDSVVLDYNWAVPHLPLEQRLGNSTGDSVAPRGGLHLVAAYLQEVAPAASTLDSAQRLALMAARLQELAELADEALLGRYRAALTRSQAVALQSINDRLADTGSLDADWQQYLETQGQACVAALQQPASLADNPAVASGTPAEVVRGRVRSAAAGFAQALRDWPLLREAARQLSP
jgi:hypothetical protein